ncbi:hypothetical protein QE5_0616 [Clostridioides difficile CD90]|nr:hypothetical protein QE5_0616 [Clostridioides difficile CD90]
MMDEKILELLQEMQGSISGIEGTISDMQAISMVSKHY